MSVFQNLMKPRHDKRYPAVLSNLTQRQLDDLGIDMPARRSSPARSRHMQPNEAWPKS